jgi:hypothetical protein
MPEGAAPEYTTVRREFGIGTTATPWGRAATGPGLGLSARARAGPGLRWQDGIADAPSEATGVESGGVRMLRPVRVDLQELVTELPLQLGAASGRWPGRARSERGHGEGLNQRRLAATVPVSHFMQRRLESAQCSAGCFKDITQALVEPRDAARGLELRVEFVELDRRRELPTDQPAGATSGRSAGLRPGSSLRCGWRSQLARPSSCTVGYGP